MMIEKFTQIFVKNTSKEIGENFLKILDQIGKNNRRDALLILSMFSSYITMPKIKERLYETKQYLRLGKLSFIFDHQFEQITKSFLPIYYGSQMVKLGDTWISYSRKYHFFAALYIGCELKKRNHSNFMTRLATASIGLAYETKDFYGHYFLEDDSFDLSYRNFEMDSGKYFDGGKLATQICN